MTNPISRDLLIAQLRKNRDQFAFYATNHRAKTGDPLLTQGAREEALTKAEANETMVAEIDALLEGADAEPICLDCGAQVNERYDCHETFMATATQALRDAENERRADLIGTMRHAHDHIMGLAARVDELEPKAHAYDTLAQIARLTRHEEPQSYGIDVRWRLKGAIEELIREQDTRRQASSAKPAPKQASQGKA